eukprot:scpid82472/ scgid11359/ 
MDSDIANCRCCLAMILACVCLCMYQLKSSTIHPLAVCIPGHNLFSTLCLVTMTCVCVLCVCLCVRVCVCACTCVTLYLHGKLGNKETNESFKIVFVKFQVLSIILFLILREIFS